MNQLRHLVVALAAAGAGLLTGTTARASAPPDVPDEYLTASETEIPGEAEFWFDAIPCPDLEGLVTDEVGFVYASGDRVTRTCAYYEGDTSTFANSRGSISVDWVKPGDDGGLFCGYNSGDLGWEVVFGDPNLNAQAKAEFNGWPDLAEQFAPYAEAWFEQWARPLAAPCSPGDVPDCPPIDGWVRDGFFGPQDRMEITPPPGSESAATTRMITYSCGYSAPSASYDEQIRVSIGTTALVPDERNTPGEVQVACSTGDRFSYGVGIRGTGGTHAVSTTYSTTSPDPFDLSPFMSAIDDIVEIASAVAIPCAGVELLPSDPFTPLPPWLEEVFTSEATMTGLVPLVSEIEAGTTATGTAPTASAPDAPSTTAPPTTGGDDPDQTATTVAPVPTADPPAAATADDGGRSTLGLLMKIVAVGSIVISALGLVFTFWFVGRETRVRPKWDVARIAISVIVAAVMVIVFAAGAPAWAIAVAVVLGLGLGVWQGRNLVVTMTERGVFAKRNAWAVAAFLVGIIITQVAGLLNRTNVFRAGIALTIFSAALAVGLYFGRRPKIEAVRAAAAVFIAFVVLGPLFALTPSGGTSASAPEPDDEQLSPRPELTAELTEMADWTSATISGGLWSNQGKPLLELSIPTGFDAVPDPVTWNVAWDDAWNEGYRYDLTETYTFSMRADGICCSIDYQAVGDRLRGDVVDPVDFDARLADIQLLSTEGPGYLGDDLGWLPGLPFAERLEHRLGAEPEAADCHRPVAETRDYDSLQEVGGDVEIRKGLGNLVQPGLQTVVGVPCEIPEFTLEAALELAPEPPPPDDPVRVNGQLGNCPVTSELIAALNAGSTLPGVHTETAGMVMFDGNANACEFGALFGGPAIGQGGRGETRHEFAMDLAQPRDGEWDRGVDAWFPDECCIAPASVTQPPSDDICSVDEQGIPVAPPDLADGGSCFHASRHQLPQGEIYIETDYDLADGPDTFIRAQMPWGAFLYNCHHCEVGDPQIATMLDTIIQTGRGMAADVTYVVATPDMVVSEDTVQVGNVPPTTPEGSPATTAVEPTDDTTAQPDEVTVAEAEDLADLVLDDDATDAEREAAVAVIIGLIGAGAVGATTLGEAGVGAREVLDAWRTGGRRAVDDLIDERNRPPDDADLGDVSVYDPRTETSTWMSQEEADDFYDRLRDEQIAASIAAGRQSGRDWVEAWERAAEVERAAERDARIAAQQAWDRYDRLGDLAIDQDRLDILERLSRDETVFDEQGNLDRERLDRLTDIMRDHLWGEQVAPDPEYSETGQLIVDIGTTADEFSRSIPVRIATGMATGGLSEIYHQGRTVVESVRDAAERSVEWTFDPATGTWKPPQEDFGVIDGIRVAMDTNARENLPGYGTATTLLDPNATAGDVAGAVFWDAIGAQMARGELDEAMDQLRRVGGSGRIPGGTRLVTPDPDLPRIRAEAGEVIAPGPYRPDFLPQHRVGDDLGRLARGEVVPNDLIHQTGWTQSQIDHMNRIARQNDAIIDARTTRPESMRLIREGRAVPKPMPVKSKTLGIEDYYAGGCELDDIGKVGYYDPADVVPRPIPADAPPGLQARVDERIAARAAEVGKLDGYAGLDGVEVRNGVVYDVDTGLPYAGDIDAVAFRDRATGQPLTGERLARAEAMWRNETYVGPGGEVTPPNPDWQAAGAGQHGAEVNAAMGVIDGKVQARIAELDPAHPNYLDHLREAQHAGYADARDFQNGLLDNSVGPRATETTLSIDGSGPPRIADTEWAQDLLR